MATTAGDILNAVAAAILGAGISGIATANVKPRKVAQRFDTDPALLCLVVLSGEKTAPLTNMTVRGRYPVHVLFVSKGTATVAKSNGWMEGARRKAWEALYKPRLLGNNGVVCACEYDSEPPFDREKFDENDDVSAQLFTYWTEELRPTSS